MSDSNMTSQSVLDPTTSQVDGVAGKSTPNEPAGGSGLPNPSGDRIYTPSPDENQLTARAIIVGCFVGSIVACTNIYIGLKIGWTFGASIVSAVLGFAIFSAMRQNLSVLETNITQTAGSAAGSMASAAGLVAAIPAMQLLGYEISTGSLMLWSLAAGWTVPRAIYVVDGGDHARPNMCPSYLSRTRGRHTVDVHFVRAAPDRGPVEKYLGARDAIRKTRKKHWWTGASRGSND